MAIVDARPDVDDLSFLVDEYQPTRLPVLGTQQVEFGTVGWLDLARDYLTPRVADRRDSLRGLRLAVDEVYTDAPPHLEFTDGVAAIHIVIDDGELTVGVGTLDEPDVRVSGNYDQAATLHTAVYEQMPDRRERLTRELTHHQRSELNNVSGPI